MFGAWLNWELNLLEVLYTFMEKRHATYIHTYIHTYHFIGPQILSYNSQIWNLSEKHNTQTKEMNTNTIQYNSFISIQPWRLGLAGTRAQSYDLYGSGTPHPGQVLGGSLPLLSPAFRGSHFSRQVPPSATTWEILAAKGGTVGEKDVR